MPFMSLLKALIVKNSHFLAGIYFLSFKLGPQWKDRENSYQVRQILVLFCNLVALILG